MADSTKIELIAPHRCRARVLYGDTDAGGVVYYGNYLRYFERGRTELMRERGISYRELEDRGLIMPVVEAYSRYKASARYDDLIEIATSFIWVKRLSCRFNYEIRQTADQGLLIKGFTLHAVVNHQGKLTKLPDDIFIALQEIIDNPPVINLTKKHDRL